MHCYNLLAILVTDIFNQIINVVNVLGQIKIVVASNPSVKRFKQNKENYTDLC